MNKKKLLVIIMDEWSALIKKGEVIDRYYNPGNFFEEVHILMINEDKPDVAQMQKMVGSAQLFLYNLPVPSFTKTFGWRNIFITSFIQNGISIANNIHPHLIRCYGNSLNVILAQRIKNRLKIPLLVSIHTQADESRKIISGKFGYNYLSYQLENRALDNVDLVLPVYKAIIPYLKERGNMAYEVCYNMLNNGCLISKEKFELNNPVEIICVGRQIPGKNPENIIRAVQLIPNLKLTVVGDGSFHKPLLNLAIQLGLNERVQFVKAIPNDELCGQLSNFDIFLGNSYYSGISKSIIEAMLVGLPCIHNKSDELKLEELEMAGVLMVADTVDGYYNGLVSLINDGDFRIGIAKKAQQYAQQNFSPIKTEAKFAEIYSHFVKPDVKIKSIDSKKLLVIIMDRWSVLIEKGEVIDRYYNPGNLFEEVHILMINEDMPDSTKMQKMAGSAKLFLYNLPAPPFKKTLGWQNLFIQSFIKKGIALAHQIQPHLIRCYGHNLNVILAQRIKKQLKIPLLVSIHTQADESRKIIPDKIGYNYLASQLENRALDNVDLVLPVYKAIIPYLKERGNMAYEVCYNMLNNGCLISKEKFELNNPVKIICVGRQIRGKNPEKIIKAIQYIPDIKLTIVGDGSLHRSMVDLANKLELNDRVQFLKSLPNDDLCKQLPNFDLFVAHSEYAEISKSIIEPMLIGLPCIHNKRAGLVVEELEKSGVLMVENTVEGYRQGINLLINDNNLRISLAKKSYKYAQQFFSPLQTEAKFVEVYSKFVSSEA